MARRGPKGKVKIINSSEVGYELLCGRVTCPNATGQTDGEAWVIGGGHTILPRPTSRKELRRIGRENANGFAQRMQRNCSECKE